MLVAVKPGRKWWPSRIMNGKDNQMLKEQFTLIRCHTCWRFQLQFAIVRMCSAGWALTWANGLASDASTECPVVFFGCKQLGTGTEVAWTQRCQDPGVARPTLGRWRRKQAAQTTTSSSRLSAAQSYAQQWKEEVPPSVSFFFHWHTRYLYTMQRLW